MANWLDLARQAYEASTTYIDANYRKDWDYSIKAFRNEHAPGSKYLSSEYQGRSKIFHPKTRSIIRKNEAAGAIALFSNMEIVDVSAGNPDDAMNVASAAAVKALIEYRLSRTIPAFPLVIGGLQDAQTTGTVCSYQYWEYEKRNGKIIKDKPCIELRPIENIRIDPGANWIDPVSTSPYFCDILPTYVCDLKGMMKSTDEKTGKPKWKTYEDSVILRARPDVMDSTRRAREGSFQDPQTEKTGIKEFDIVWVMRWFMKDSQGDDFCFYTLGTEDLLSDAKPLEEVYFHGKRPYVIGYSILETHKALKTPIPILVKPLQQAVNTLGNQRFDNVQFVLNKRWIVARGRQVDVPSLVRNVPGGVTLTNNPKEDVQESNWADVTSSSYVEHDRLNSELDDLAGNFSPSTRVANKAMNDTLGGSRLALQGAGLMSDYLLRTVIETWWEPVLRQLALLEQYYETDDLVLGVAASKARLFPRFGVSRITDMLLMKEVNINVNVGMGASNPNERMGRFLAATAAAIKLIGEAPPGFNVQEGIKEIYSNAGYRDGARFISDQIDPRLMRAMQMIQKLQGALEGKQMEIQAQHQHEMHKLISGERVKSAELSIDQARIAGDLRIREAEFLVERERLELEKLKIQLELQAMAEEHALNAAEIGTGIEEARLKLQTEREKAVATIATAQANLQKAEIDLQKAKEEKDGPKMSEVADHVTRSVGDMSGMIHSLGESLMSIQGGLSGIGTRLEDTRKGLGAMVGVMMQPKKKPKGFKLRKPDGKNTSAVVVDFDDGSTEELTVGRG